MTIIYTNALNSLDGLVVHGPQAEIAEWQGRPMLKLNGLVSVPQLALEKGSLSVWIAAPGPTYAGGVFRLVDAGDFELAYVQPHTSGKWDALQYDPVFNGSNTWQIYYGQGFQQNAEIPAGGWFRLQLDFNESQAVLRVNDQPALWVPHLAHETRSGAVGLWCYLPAYFCDLQVNDRPVDFSETPLQARLKKPEAGAILEWLAAGHGVVTCEAHGILNLNRYFQPSAGPVQLERWFETSAPQQVRLRVGFSDEASVRLDGELLYEGENKWHDVPEYELRGYVEPTYELRPHVSAGRHCLQISVKVSEPFGWGAAAILEGEELRLLPLESAG